MAKTNSTPNSGLNQVRIAYVLKKENLLTAVEILKEALKAYKNEKWDKKEIFH